MQEFSSFTFNSGTRSDTPLIYRAIPAWFVKVAPIVDDLVANNEGTRWYDGPNATSYSIFLQLHRVPQSVGDNRFGNWLANARDWNVSRNRYWGTPMPLWVSTDLEEVGQSSTTAMTPDN